MKLAIIGSMVGIVMDSDDWLSIWNPPPGHLAQTKPGLAHTATRRVMKLFTGRNAGYILSCLCGAVLIGWNWVGRSDVV